MFIVETKRLGLAAYLHMKGCELVSIKKGVFSFRSEKSLSDWEIIYQNSESSRHDMCVCELRKLMR